jgi:hypothetical protein
VRAHATQRAVSCDLPRTADYKRGPTTRSKSMRSLSAFVAAAAVLNVAHAQLPQFQMSPASAITLGGAVATYQVTGTGGAAFAVFADIDGGPRDVLGERLYLGLTPALVPLLSGAMPASGAFSNAFTIPLLPGLAGLVIYGQSIEIDVAAPNGLFRVSGGASTSFHIGSAALVASMDAASLAGFTGTFAADIAGHVRGGPVTVRTHHTVDPQGIFFPQPILTPLVPFGCRQQIVYRTQDVGATGEVELLTAVRWRPHPAIVLLPDSFASFEVRAGHTQVVPDYSIDPFSALPQFPLSGLSTTFADNVIPTALPQVMFQGQYVILPSALQPNGYLPYPIAAPFRYDGVSSLLLEFRVGPGSGNGWNGGVVNLMVQSAAEPYGRVAASGTPGNPLIPSQATVATIADNTMHDLELEFARVETFCQSPWLDSGTASADYGSPVLARSLPTGTDVQMQFRGSATAGGTLPTAWSASPDIADGQRFLQFKLVFRANHLTGERPVVDTLVVPLH